MQGGTPTWELGGKSEFRGFPEQAKVIWNGELQKDILELGGGERGCPLFFLSFFFFFFCFFFNVYFK